MKNHRLIHIGTSGWHYRHWKGPFYPADALSENFLAYYAEHFHTVEINNTYYQMPKEKTLIQWRDTVSEEFIFSVKASRYITHMKKLKDAVQPTSSFLEKVTVLGDKLGPILFQLPPRWHCNPERLNSFLKILPEGYRYAFEFRDPSWFNNETYDTLAENRSAFCIYDLDRNLSPKIVTADFVYIRLHGPNGAYKGEYTTEVLAGWADELSTWLREGKEIYCYFDNDEKGYAAKDSLRLQGMIEKLGK